MVNENSIVGFIDTHVHTAPDIKPRVLNDIEAAEEAKKECMQAIVIKSHVESTAGRARIAEEMSGLKVFGGVCLNLSIGGLNPDAVKATVGLGGKIIWFPTISAGKININFENTEEILNIIAGNDLILGTGHLKPDDIFLLLDHAKDIKISKIIINHPLTGVVGATIDEQKEMAKKAYLEHCFVACMKKHDNLDPNLMANAIKEIGPKRCIMATDFGQSHNPKPAEGMKMFKNSMRECGIKKEEIYMMCIKNPSKLLLK
ncbi:MAG: DUF6282 family protein [Methanobacterium sp.]